MQGILIDNGSTLIVQLVAIFKLLGADLRVVKLEEFEPDTADYDFAILSGSSRHSVQKYAKTIYAKEIEFITTTEIPVLGICLGFELIAAAFDGSIRRLPRKAIGMKTIQVAECDGLFSKTGDLEVYESHRWIVAGVGPELQVLATSDTGIEAIEHRTKQIRGVQFHPELSGVQGQAIFTKFLNSLSA